MTTTAEPIIQRDSQQLLFGADAPAAIAAIHARAERRRAGDNSSDGRKIALVVEGGGMRGVDSGGGMVALAHMGYADIFVHIYATSAGVMNASYFLSHQPELGISVYYESLSSRKFWNPMRFWKILDVDYVFDRVVTIDKPLDVARVLASKTQFFLPVIDRAGQAQVIDVKNSRQPLLKLLKAATSVPVFYNRTVELDGKRCMDGGLLHGVPIEPALTAGCTDALVLLTRSSEHKPLQPPLWSRLVFNILCARGRRALSKVYKDYHKREAHLRELAFGRCPSNTMANIATVCPSHPETVHLATIDSAILKEAATQYGRSVFRIFGRADLADARKPFF